MNALLPMITMSAVERRTAHNCYHYIDDDQNHSCNSSHPAYIGPPHLPLHSASIPFEGKGLALKVICFVDKQLNPFAPLKNLYSEEHEPHCYEPSLFVS